jgi:hypothetical protein
MIPSMSETDFYILVCGARDWDDYTMILRTISSINEVCADGSQQLHVISGAQRAESKDGESWVGADWLAIEACMELQLPFHGYPAQWNIARMKYGRNWRRAGIDRNAWQLREHRSHLAQAHAFHDNIGNSTGTKDMVDRLYKAQVPVTVHAHS